MLRANTTVELYSEPDRGIGKKATLIVKMLTGKLLSVFGKGNNRLVTRTAVAGVRGTAVYLESEPARTYICTCYGTAHIVSRHAKDIRETVECHHHDQPRFVYGPGVEDTIARAPVFNHTDAELLMLESIAGRKPPFVGTSKTY